MEEAVEQICWSLVNESHLWVFETFTFHKKGTNIEYWCSAGTSESITETRDVSLSKVFSYEQGVRIKKAYDIARENQASVKQQEIIEAMTVKQKDQSEQNTKRWWGFWK